MKRILCGTLSLVLLMALLVLAGCDRDRIVRIQVKPVQIISSPQFQNIDSIVVDRDGRIYVSDVLVVRVFDTKGRQVAEIGQSAEGAGVFSDEVIGLGINSQQELYAVDEQQMRVEVFDLAGNHLRYFGEAGDGPGQFLVPQGLVIDKYDLVYVSDKVRNDVQVFSRRGEYLFGIGKSGKRDSDLNEPESMAINRERLYVADEGNHRVQVYGVRGRHLGSLPHSGIFAMDEQLAASLDDVPHLTDVDKKYERFIEGDLEGMAFDERGVLYVLNEDAGEMLVFKGEVLMGKFTSAEAISSGDGLAFSPGFERLYVVDQGNGRIQVFEVAAIRQGLKLQ